MIVVIAHVRAKSGHEVPFEGVLRALVPPTRAEAGCIQYDLHQSSEDPCAFAFYERWASPEALDEHMKTPHIATAFAALPEHADGAPSIVVYSLLDA